jgi:hypothetical protein
MQPYALLVDLSDSHSFSLSLHRSIALRLRSLLEAAQASQPSKHMHGSAVGEKAVGISCLSSFLGYLSFRHQPSLSTISSLTSSHLASGSQVLCPLIISLSPPPAIDLSGLLEPLATEASSDISFLAVHIPCIYSFLLPYLCLSSLNQRLSPLQANALDHPPLLIKGIKSLMKLRSSPLLAIPSNDPDEISTQSKRGAAVICIRFLLDDLHQRIVATFGPHCPFLPTFVSSSPSSLVSQSLVKESEIEFYPDLGFMELCCPSIAQSCRELEASASRFRSSSVQATGDQSQGEGSSTHPSVPPRRVYAHPVHFGSLTQHGLISIKLGPSTSSSSHDSYPPSYSEILSRTSVSSSSSSQGGEDEVREKLKQLFISQYSTEDAPIKMKDVLSYLTDNVTTNILCQVMKPLPSSLNQAADLAKEDAGDGECIVARVIHQGCSVTIPNDAAKALLASGISLLSFPLSSIQDEAVIDKVKSAIAKAAKDLAPVIFNEALELASKVCLSMLKDKQLGHKNGPLSALLPSSVPSAAVTAAANVAERDILSVIATRLLAQIQSQVQKQVVSIVQRPEGSLPAVSKALAGLRLESVAEESGGPQPQGDQEPPSLTLMAPCSNLEDLVLSLAALPQGLMPNDASLSSLLSAIATKADDDVVSEGQKIAHQLHTAVLQGQVKGPLEIESVLCRLLTLDPSVGLDKKKMDRVAWTGVHFFAHCSEKTISDQRHVEAWIGVEDSDLTLLTLLPSKLIGFAVETENIELISMTRKTLQRISFASIGLV